MIKVGLLISIGVVLATAIPHTKLTSHSKGPGGRIIGGQPARPLQFPYAAAIYVSTSNSRHFCAGTLLSDLWVLTAGQCVDGAISFQILLGSIHLSPEPSQVEVATSTYFLHPEFDADTLANDIGLIKFRLPVTFTDYIGPILALPLNEVGDYVSNLSIFGWGQTNEFDEGLSDSLQWVTVTTISNAECQHVYGSAITDKMVCVAGNYNQGTCYGDIGGSLVIYGNTGHSIPVAISSFLSTNGCESINPSGFTRVHPYNAWIRNVTELNI